MSQIERNIYLSNVDLHEAIELFSKSFDDFSSLRRSEIIPVTESLGRITKEPVFAKISSPHYNAAAMDGIAVKAASTYGADENNPVRLKLNKDFKYIDTGDVIEDPFDAVIMIEDVVTIDEETVEIIKAASPWQHVRPVGEDIVANEMIIPASHKIRPFDIGALLSGGIVEVEVISMPKVGIIPTGTEIIEPWDKIEPGKIIDSNSRMFENLVKEYGGLPVRYNPVIDDYELIKKQVKAAMAENDIVIVNAGSSAGSEDYTPHIVKELGELIVYGVAIKPGKPVVLGKIDNKPLIGIPGYPVSAYFVFEAFVKPLIFKILNLEVKKRPVAKAVLSKRIVSSLKHLEFARMKLGKVEDKLIATPLSRGAGVTTSLVKADGITIIPKHIEGFEAGEMIDVELLRDLEEIENTIVSIGSHDIIMDLIGTMIHAKYPKMSLSSAHVGSLGGIMAIKRGEAHLAPVHLLDEETGIYNLSYIRRFLGDKEVVLVKGIKRQQGIMVRKGNPKKIKGIEDLTREDVTFVNRQKGSGTRVLLDYKLKQLGIDAAKIVGYDREMTTHMTVASAIISGTADAGIGIKSVANVMELDFIPIGEEEYDFVLEQKFLEQENIKVFLEILQSEEFKQKLLELGGYSLEEPGKLIYP